MQRINLNRTFNVRTIYFTNDRPPLHDREVFLLDGFLVVSGADQEDAEPIWYALHTIERLEGVEFLPLTQTKMQLRVTNDF